MTVEAGRSDVGKCCSINIREHKTSRAFEIVFSAGQVNVFGKGASDRCGQGHGGSHHPPLTYVQTNIGSLRTPLTSSKPTLDAEAVFCVTAV